MILGDETCCRHTFEMNFKFVEATDNAILLVITIDKKLSFSKQINKLRRNAQYELLVL